MATEYGAQIDQLETCWGGGGRSFDRVCRYIFVISCQNSLEVELEFHSPKVPHPPHDPGLASHPWIHVDFWGGTTPPPESLFLSCKNNYSGQKGSCHPPKILEFLGKFEQNAGTYLKYPKMQWKDSIIHKAFEGLGGYHMLEFSVSDDWCWLFFPVPFGSLWNGFSRVTLATHHFCRGISNPIAAKMLEGWGWGSKYLNTAWIIVGTMSQNMDVPPGRFFFHKLN